MMPRSSRRDSNYQVASNEIFSLLVSCGFWFRRRSVIAGRRITTLFYAIPKIEYTVFMPMSTSGDMNRPKTPVRMRPIMMNTPYGSIFEY